MSRFGVRAQFGKCFLRLLNAPFGDSANLLCSLGRIEGREFDVLDRSVLPVILACGFGLIASGPRSPTPDAYTIGADF
ncbi:hypothetical protein [Mesorhizobium sp. M0700]|uniref:hypothetical protein n=1 Tax=Mesorhizobium sp. M0700 TaxID=2956988 RepID=UPI00333BDCB3